MPNSHSSSRSSGPSSILPNRQSRSSLNHQTSAQPLNATDPFDLRQLSQPGLGAPGGEEDAIFQMMRSMGLEIPTELSQSGLGSGHIPRPNPMMMPGQASSLVTEPTFADRLFPLVNLICVFGLVISAVVWWAPMSALWNPTQERDDASIDLRAEWEALQTGSPSVASKTLGPAPVFWMFVTAELTLQAGRWMFKPVSEIHIAYRSPSH